MFPSMEEVIISAVIGELAGRCISFAIESCSKRVTPPSTEEENLDSLQWLLLRLGAIVDDAEARRITNQAMLQQLDRMRYEMHRGHFMLDTSRCHLYHQKKAPLDHESGNQSLALSIFNLTKCLWPSRYASEEMQGILASLETIIHGATEFIQLSGRYPRLPRQPYDMYLLLDNCMFGRQMEMEHIVNFMHQDTGAEHLGVLPIVGPENVGKSTLVEHVCIDERVRKYFEQILFISGGNLSGEDMDVTGVIKYQNQAVSGRSKVLIIVEADRDINQNSWQRLYFAAKARFARGSKIIVTSRSDKIVKFGTTLPLRMQLLSKEPYWYFFKVRTFGSVDVTREYPKLASVAMEMTEEMSGSFIAASIFGRVLKSSPVGSWSLTLSRYREFKRRNCFISNKNLVDPWDQTSVPILVPAENRFFVVVNRCKTQSSHGHDGETPKVLVEDVMSGNATPHGKFHALAFSSHIPPYYDYVFRCEMQQPMGPVSRKKRIRKRTRLGC